MNTKTARKTKIGFPHVLIIMIGLILLLCALSYVVPAGVYDIDPVTNMVIPESFHYVDQNPISPLKALFMLYDGISNSGAMFALVMVIGGMIYMIISSKSIEEIIDYSLWKLKEKGATILIPVIMILISLLGTLAGNDSKITFLFVGLLFVKRLNLDRIAAMSIFYLPYISGQAVGPTTAIIVLAQEQAGVQVMSGLGVRTVLWVIITSFCIFYTMRYCKKIANDPSKSIMGFIERMDEGEDIDLTKERSLSVKAFLSALFLVIPFVVYAIGAASWGFGMGHLIGLSFAACIIVSLIHRFSPNEFARRFMTGAGELGAVCMLVGFGRVAGMVLADSNIINTISHGAIGLIGRLGAGGSAVGMYIFTLLFNLLMPNGLAKLPIIMPLFIPVADVLGVSRQTLCLCYQLGDGLTNFVTPMSSVLASGLMIAGVSYGKWMKYILPYLAVLVVFSGAVIVLLQSVGWG